MLGGWRLRDRASLRAKGFDHEHDHEQSRGRARQKRAAQHRACEQRMFGVEREQ